MAIPDEVGPWTGERDAAQTHRDHPRRISRNLRMAATAPSVTCMPSPTRTWSTGTPSWTDPMSCGAPTSLSTRRSKGRCTARPFSTPVHGVSWDGRSTTTCAPRWSSTRWAWRSPAADRSGIPRSYIRITGRSSRHGHSGSACRRRPRRIDGLDRRLLRQLQATPFQHRNALACGPRSSPHSPPRTTTVPPVVPHGQ